MNGINSVIFKFFYLLIVCAATSLVIQFHFGNTISWLKDLCKVCSCSFSDDFFAFSFAHIYAALAKQPKQRVEYLHFTTSNFETKVDVYYLFIFHFKFAKAPDGI